MMQWYTRAPPLDQVAVARGHCLGHLLVAMQHLVGAAQAGEVLLSPLQARITTYGGALRPLRVVAAALGDFAGCLGAGRLALRLLAAP